jgi:hypothetical protein
MSDIYYQPIYTNYNEKYGHLFIDFCPSNDFKTVIKTVVSLLQKNQWLAIDNEIYEIPIEDKDYDQDNYKDCEDSEEKDLIFYFKNEITDIISPYDLIKFVETYTKYYEDHGKLEIRKYLFDKTNKTFTIIK